jgi:uncharacterized DUF497 family protein
MRFSWDPSKALSNRAKHGISFDFALRIFEDAAHIDVDASRDEDGEQRRKAIGRVDGKLYSVVYTRRGAITWIISARRTNPKENRYYGGIRP